MQAGRGFIEHVEGVTRRTARQFGGELHALGFAPRERGGGLAESHVTQTHIHQALHVAQDERLALEELQRLGDRHREDVGDGLAPIQDLEGLAVVARTVAHVTVHVHVGQEVHLDLDGPVPGAGLTTPALDVEGEATLLVPADLGLLGLGEEFANLVEDPRVRRGVRARGATDGLLVDGDDLVEVLDPEDGVVLGRDGLRPVDLSLQ